MFVPFCSVWALDIFSGAGSDGCEHNSMFTLFSITIVLTDVGLTHLHEVCILLSMCRSDGEKLAPLYITRGFNLKVF